MAEGVMVLGIGHGTKLLNTYLNGSKGYRAVAKMGQATDTLDITGTVTETCDTSSITIKDIEAALPKFRGDILQVPPMYSALRMNRQRLYDLARSGVVVDREARPVSVYNLQVVEGPNLPYFALEIECGGGTYVRSLIDDLCREIGVVGCMTELVRTKQAAFTIDHCLEAEALTVDSVIEHVGVCNQIAGISKRDLDYHVK
jgi:tRNA pseudouridine55 synthase